MRTSNSEIQVPRVIRLTGYEKLPKHTVKFNRRNIFARDNNQCQYCGKKFPTSDLSLDHVVPRSQGGESTWENIVCACIDCNVRKGGRTPKQAHMGLIRKPEKPKRSPTAQSEADQQEVSVVEDVPGQCVLVGGVEVITRPAVLRRAFFFPRRPAMIELTSEQRLELGTDTPRAIDPQTRHPLCARAGRRV